MTAKVTVVIPVYNRQEELLRALRSVQHQTFKDFECIRYSPRIWRKPTSLALEGPPFTSFHT